MNTTTRQKPVATATLELEQMRALVAELAAALGQIDAEALDPEVSARFDRAWAAARALTRHVGIEAARHAAEAAGQQEALPDLLGYRVLLAVANAEDQVHIGRMLGQMGARYDLAGDGATALTWLGEGGFDLAVIDADLTETPGARVIAALRRHAPPLGRVPVLGLCREGAEAARQSLRREGADFTMSSPVTDIFALAAALSGIIEAAQNEAAVPDRLLLDFDCYQRLLEIAGEDGAQELLDRLLEDLQQVDRGLERALSEQNPAEIRTQTHVLIALAGAVGADTLQGQAEQLNAAAHRKTADGMLNLGRQTLRQLGHLIKFISEESSVGE